MDQAAHHRSSAAFVLTSLPLLLPRTAILPSSPPCSYCLRSSPLCDPFTRRCTRKNTHRLPSTAPLLHAQLTRYQLRSPLRCPFSMSPHLHQLRQTRPQMAQNASGRQRLPTLSTRSQPTQAPVTTMGGLQPKQEDRHGTDRPVHPALTRSSQHR